jgi:hypothetical protein
LTEHAISTNSTFRKVSTADGSVWESRLPTLIAEGLPVKIQVGLGPARQDADDEMPGLRWITVYSFAEWNNRFNDNAILRLRFRKESRED